MFIPTAIARELTALHAEELRTHVRRHAHVVDAHSTITSTEPKGEGPRVRVGGIPQANAKSLRHSSC